MVVNKFVVGLLLLVLLVHLSIDTMPTTLYLKLHFVV